ncbi:MAG: hypothetical protein WCR45_11375 [Bacteroidaceae bacterium]
MKCSGNYTGILPTLNVIEEGTMLRIFFDYEDVPTTEEDGNVRKYMCENVDVEGKSYADIVSALIRSMYSQDRVEAVMANYEVAKDATSTITEIKRSEYLSEYNNYQNYRQKAKQIAGEVTSKL